MQSHGQRTNEGYARQSVQQPPPQKQASLQNDSSWYHGQQQHQYQYQHHPQLQHHSPVQPQTHPSFQQHISNGGQALLRPADIISAPARSQQQNLARPDYALPQNPSYPNYQQQQVPVQPHYLPQLNAVHHNYQQQNAQRIQDVPARSQQQNFVRPEYQPPQHAGHPQQQNLARPDCAQPQNPSFPSYQQLQNPVQPNYPPQQIAVQQQLQNEQRIHDARPLANDQPVHPANQSNHMSSSAQYQQWPATNAPPLPLSQQQYPNNAYPPQSQPAPTTKWQSSQGFVVADGTPPLPPTQQLQTPRQAFPSSIPAPTQHETRSVSESQNGYSTNESLLQNGSVSEELPRFQRNHHFLNTRVKSDLKNRAYRLTKEDGGEELVVFCQYNPVHVYNIDEIVNHERTCKSYWDNAQKEK